MKNRTRQMSASHTQWAVVITCVFMLVMPVRTATASASPQAFDYPYGVFLSLDASQSSRLTNYQTIVIDAAYFKKADIDSLKHAGHNVYSYLNIGSLEDFRPYYARFKGSTLAPYANWADERWMDVSDPQWQDYLCDVLADALLAKGADGFFIDNCDVYYQYPTQPILDGLMNILHRLRATGADILINGGDTFVSAYDSLYGNLSNILTGINQEFVFSGYDFDRKKFALASKEDHRYFTEYIESVAKTGAQVYLLEYTQDQAVMDEIAAYCEEKGFQYYIADSIELD